MCSICLNVSFLVLSFECVRVSQWVSIEMDIASATCFNQANTRILMQRTDGGSQQLFWKHVIRDA